MAPLLLASLLAASAPALAQGGEVFVLGIRSVEGDDQLSRELTGAIRQEAREVAEWSVSPADISLAQMSVAHGCDEPDAQCMAEIAAELEASRIIYGTVRRTGAGEQYDYALTLYNFNAQSGQIEDQLTDTIPSVQSEYDALVPRATRYVAQFAGQARFGSVRIATNTPGATVYIDDENAGVTDEAGALLVTDVTEGSRSVRVEALDHEPFEGAVTVVPDEQTELRATLAQVQGTNLGWLPGAGLIAAGAALGAVGITYSVKALRYIRQRGDVLDLDEANRACIRSGLPVGRIGDAERADALSMCSVAQAALGELTPFQAGLVSAQTTGSVCDDPDPNIEGLEEACSDRTKYRILQWVFYVLGAAAVGGGTYLLLQGLEDGESSESNQSNVRLDIQPWMAGRRDMGVNATLEF